MIDKKEAWQITVFHHAGDDVICLHVDAGHAMTEDGKRRFMLRVLAACVKSLADDVADETDLEPGMPYLE